MKCATLIRRSEKVGQRNREHHARVVPIRAVAISSPIANAISLPLNHFTIILETVIPAISTPTPKIAYPNAARVTCVLNPKSMAPSGKVVEIA